MGQQSQYNRHLSPRQQEILRLLPSGKGNKEIGVELGLSAQTVKNHLYDIYNKLGVENRTQAAIVAYEFQESAKQRGD